MNETTLVSSSKTFHTELATGDFQLRECMSVSAFWVFAREVITSFSFEEFYFDSF